MAGDWIKMRGNLWDDPRVGGLCDATGASEATVIGGLYWLWATADQHSEDGIMPGLTLRSIDRKTGIQGFAEALIAIGWLADQSSGVCIVRFEEHNGASAKRRCMDAQRKANLRNVSALEADNERTGSGQISTDRGAREREEKEKIEPKATPKTKNVAPAALPDWLRPEDWERWKQHRRQKITPQAAVLQIRKLEALRAQGHEPAALIDAAIEGGWATFYAPRNHSPPSRTPTIAERRTATLDAITGKTHARDITSTASRVDSPVIRPLPVGLREQDGNDVGSSGPCGPLAGVG